MAGRFTARRVAAPEMPAIEEPAPSTSSALWKELQGTPAEPAVPEPPQTNPLLSDKLLDAKVRLHRRLIEEINLSALEKLPEGEIRRHVTPDISRVLSMRAPRAREDTEIQRANDRRDLRRRHHYCQTPGYAQHAERRAQNLVLM